MLTTFVLIMWMDGFKAAGLSMQEFNTQSACQFAAAEVKDVFKVGIQTIHFVCVPKGPA